MLNNSKSKKKFTVKIKSKLGGVASQLVNFPVECMLKYVGANENPGLLDNYNGILGVDHPMDELLCSNVGESERVSSGLTTALERHFGAGPRWVGMWSRRFGVTPGSNPEIDVVRLRKMVPRKADDSLGSIDLYPVPQASDPSGFGIAIDVRGMLIGVNGDARFPSPHARRSRIGSLGNVALTWVPSIDAAELANEVALWVKPRFTLPLELERKIGLNFPDDWESGRDLRAITMLEIWSMLPMKKRLFGTGVGRSISIGEFAESDRRLRLACKKGAASIHRDGVPHFWFGEHLRRDITHLAVPLIKIR